jgi:hypothetical protein
VFNSVSGITNDRVRSKQSTRRCRREVVLTDVDAGGARHSCQICAIVDDDGGVIRTGKPHDRVTDVEEGSRRELFRAQLKNACAPIQKRARQINRRPTRVGRNINVKDGV